MNGKNAIWYGTGIDNSGLKKGKREGKKIWQQMEGDATDAGRNIEAIWKKVGTTVGVAIGAATLKEFVKSTVQIRAQRQELEASFEVLLKSGSKAKSMLTELTELATKSPLEMSHVAGAAQTLLGYGLEAEKVTGILRQLSDVSMGNADKFNSLALAYAQVQSTGKLMGQDLMQMINAGFNPLSTLAEKTGKSIGELKEQMSKGAISAQDVADAFAIATSEGGKFYGMTEKQAEGITGQIASLQDAIANMFNEIGESSEGAIGTALQGATSLVENYEKIGKILVGLITTYGAYRAALIVATAASKGYTIAMQMEYKWLLLVEKAQKILNATMLKNPLVLITTLVVGLIAATLTLRDSTTAEERARKKLNDELEVSKEKKNGLISKGNELIRIIRSETETMYAQLKALKELKKEFPEIFAAMTLEDVKNMPVPELEAKINVVLDERELQEAERRLRGAQNAVDNIQKIIDGIRSGDIEAEFMPSLKEMEGVNAELKVAKEHLDSIVKLRKEAEFEAKPTGEKLAYYQQELDSLIKQQGELEEILSTSDKITNSWGGFNLQTKKSEWALESVNKKIKETLGVIAGLSGKNASVVKNKSFWEKQKEEAETALEAMDQSQKGTDEWAKWQKQLAQSSAALKTWNFSDKDTNDALKAQEKLNELILRNDISTQESRLSIMKEGREKRLKEMKLERDKNLQAIDDEEKALEKARKDAGKGSLTESEKQGFTERRENVNTVFNNETREVEKGYAKQVEDLYRQIGDVFLTEEQRKQAAIKDTYDKLREEAKKQFEGGGMDEGRYNAVLGQIDAAETQAELEDAAKQYQDYYTKRLKAIQKFQSDRERLEEAGGSEAQRAELNYQEQETLAAIDDEFAMREDSFQAWADQVTNLAIEKLEELLTQAKAELKRMEEENPQNPALAVQRGKVNAAQEALSKAKAKNAASEDLGVDKKSMKEWKSLQKVLRGVEKDFKEIGDAVGGMTGEILGTAGEIASSTISMIDGIQLFGSSAIQATKATATGTGEAIKGVERAAVILAIIGAALQIATKIFNLISGESSADKYERTKEVYQSYIAILDKVIERQLALAESLSGEAASAAYDKAIDMYEKQIEAVKYLGQLYNKAREKNKHSYGVKMVERMTKEGWAAGAEALGMTEKEFKELMKGRMEGIYDLSAEQLKLLQEEAGIFLGQLDKEVLDFVNQIIENDNAIIEALKQEREALTGLTFDDLSDSLDDLVKQADLAFGDIEDSFADHMSNAIMRVIKSQHLNVQLEKWYAKFADAMDDSTLSKSEADDLREQYHDIVKRGNEMYAAALDLAGIEFPDEEGRSASEKGIAQASQDSIDELNGRFTAVQGHTYEINESIKASVPVWHGMSNGIANLTEINRDIQRQSADILRHVAGIHDNTDHLQYMRNDLNAMRSAIDNMNDRGIKMQ